MDVKQACDALECPKGGPKRRWSEMSMKQLLQCQKEIAAELQKRNINK